MYTSQTPTKAYAYEVMSVRKFRWSKDYESAEEELVELLQFRGIKARRIIEDPELSLPTTVADHDQRLWCAEGSFSVKAGDKQVSMQPGDALDVLSGTTYQILTGIAGCIYYLA